MFTWWGYAAVVMILRLGSVPILSVLPLRFLVILLIVVVLRLSDRIVLDNANLLRDGSEVEIPFMKLKVNGLDEYGLLNDLVDNSFPSFLRDAVSKRRPVSKHVVKIQALRI